MKKNASLLQAIKTPFSLAVILGSAFLFFDLQYFMMARLPGEYHEMCVLGAGLTPGNILFAMLLSLCIGIFIAGLIGLFQMRSFGVKSGAASGIGAIIGMLTIFCPSCTFSVISIFGIGVGFSAFSEYNFIFKILSLIFIAAGLYHLDSQIQGTCKRCID